jgi:hypothetical protein
MDYPHPLVKLRADRTIDLSDAYTLKIGEWDKVSIAAGYTQFPAGTDEAAAIDEMLRKARERGLVFLSDQDARPPSGAHPQAHLWDNGTDAAEELKRMLEVRAAALTRFGENVIRRGRPLATMEEALVPIYLGHRYQVEAAAKVIGGQHYTYAMRGDGQKAVTSVPAAEQLRALDALLTAVAPTTLRLPVPLIASLPPRPMGYEHTRELFSRRTGIAFDALAPAEAAATMTFASVFHAQRANRLIQQQALDPALPGLSEIIVRVLDATWHRAPGAGFDAEVQRVVNSAALTALFRLGADQNAGQQVNAVVAQHLLALSERLGSAGNATGTRPHQAHLAHARRLIARFIEDPKEFAPPPAPPIPPGQPIGAIGQCDFDFLAAP